MANKEDMGRTIFALADTDNDGFVWRRDLETLCRDLDLGYTADSVLPNDHRGRVTLPEFQKYFSRLPSSLIWTPGGSDRKLECLTSPGKTVDKSKILNNDAPIERKVSPSSPGITTLRSEIMDLNNRLNQVTQERNGLQQTIKLLEGKDKSELGTDQSERWEMQCQRYEERIIELHSVIAELSKKMADENDDVIKEESEYESNVDNQSIATDSFVDEKLRYQDEYEDYTSLAFERDLDIHTQSLTKRTKRCAKVDCKLDSCDNEDSAAENSDTKSDELLRQVEVQMVEIYALREQLDQSSADKQELLEQLDSKQTELNNSKSHINNLTVERDNFKRQISDLKTTVEYQEAKMESGSKSSQPLFSRFAERRSLRKKRHDKSREKEIQSPVAGTHAKPPTPDYSTPSPQPSTLPVNNDRENERYKHHQLETERLTCQLEHLKSQNDVLQLTLLESKTSCDRLTELLGRYESNNTALQLSISACDQMIESYDVLVALFETSQLVYNGNNSLEKQDSQRAQSYRKSAESVAKHLLSRLERTPRPDSGLATSHLDTTWEDSSGYSHTTSSTSTTSSGLEPDFSQNDENRLRDHISRLKMARSSIQATVMDLESVCQEQSPSLEDVASSSSHSTADLEMAVIMQEMMAMREERADLRAKVYLLEREKHGLDLCIADQQEKERLMKTKLDHLQEEMLYREASGEKGHKAVVMDDREEYLKERVENLLDTLEKITRNSEVRQKQSGDLIDDLKKANGALTEALDKSKKKYQSKIKKMEQQMLSLMSSSQMKKLMIPATNSNNL